MARLIDKIRSTEERWAGMEIHGFDPDLDTCGHAIIFANVRTDVKGIFNISQVVISRIVVENKKLKGVEKASSMVEGIHRYNLYSAVHSYSFIESQQSYPDEDMPRSEMVAKANDLIRLSHVSGAYHARALSKGHICAVLLPSEWKGNRPKEAMHRDIFGDIEAHAAQGVREKMFRYRSSSDGMIRPIESVPEFLSVKKNSHSLDALCLAFKGLVWVSRGEYESNGASNG